MPHSSIVLRVEIRGIPSGTYVLPRPHDQHDRSSSHSRTPSTSVSYRGDVEVTASVFLKSCD